MIFSIEPKTRRFVAHVPAEGRHEVYDCTADACSNPVCRCRTTTVVMRPTSGARREIGVDLDAMAIDELFRKRASPQDLAFAEKLLACMDGADFELLDKLHSLLKNRICEEAKPSEIEAHFNYDEIETSSMLQAYNDVLPFGNTFRVAVASTEYCVLDQFCVRSGCKCTDVHLNLFPVGGEGRAVDSTGAVRVDYAAADWEVVEGEPLPCDVPQFRRVMERANPDLYKTLRARHAKLRAIYIHCRQRDLKAQQTVLKAGSIGRNNPCPCGSGKKFKKCCMGKSTSSATVRANSPPASALMSITRTQKNS